MKYWALTLFLFTTATAIAGPSTAPATAPARPEDVKQGLKDYNAAMHRYDIDAMVAFQHTSTGDEKRVAKAIARADAYVAKLLHAAQEKFGGDAMVRVGKAIGDASDADIDAGEVHVRGERAVITFNSGGSAPMIRVDSRWMCEVARTISSYSGEEEAIDAFSRRGNFAKVMAQDVAAGNFKSLKELLDRIERHEGGDGEEVPN